MRKVVLIALALVLTGVACAQDEPALQGSPQPTDETTEPSPADTGSPADTASPGGTGSPEVNDHGTETFAGENFEVDLELDDFYFEPTYIKSPGGATATITLRNEGDAPHTFTVDALDVDEEVAPGESKEVTVSIGTETRYDFYCRFHRGRGMAGAFQPH